MLDSKHAELTMEQLKSAFVNKIVSLTPQAALIPILEALIGWYLLLALSRLFLSPVADVPGPFLARFSYAWKVREATRGTITRSLLALHKKYGPIVRIGPHEVSLQSAADISTLYSTKAFVKSRNYYGTWQMLGEDNAGHFGELDPDRHAVNRRPIAHIYAMKNVLEYEELMEPCISRVIELVDKAAEASSVIDMSELLHFFAYDIVGELAFGDSFGFLREDKDVGGLIDMLNKTMKWRHLLGQLPNWRWAVDNKFGERCVAPWFERYWGHDPKGMPLFELAFGRVIKRLEEVKQGTYVGRGDMLDSIIAAKDPKGQPLGLNPFNATVEAMDMLGAGSDTTATALRSALRFLLQHPSALAKARAEIDKAVSEGIVHFPITYNEAIKLVYCQAAIKEGMRLGPSVGATLPRVVPAGGAMLAGRFFKAGSIVGMSPLVAHTDKGAFGHDATQYVPERWLSTNKSDLEKNFIGFGAGSRICLGRNVSTLEIAKLIPTLIHHFDFRFETSPDAIKFWEGWFNVQTNFRLLATRRDS